jgi:1-aminocyclopropane-1-carboxylate deaminase/D-cysteine desulfhydrase-like pyridoxal-dependent ACC family enzyme
MPEDMSMHVFSALKGDFLKTEIEKKIEFAFHNPEFTTHCVSRLSVYAEDVFGGYGKHNDALINFIRWVNETFELPLDQVYTGKAFYRLFQMIQKGTFDENSHILFLHTGGLQGNTAIDLAPIVN